MCNTFGLALGIQQQRPERLEMYVDDVTYSIQSSTEQPADLQLVKAVDNPVPVGDELVQFTIAVSNSGDVAAEQVRVAEHFFPIWKSGCDGLRCEWASIAAGESESVHLVSDIFQVPDTVEHTVWLVVSSDDEDYVADHDSMMDEHLIQPFPWYSCSGGDPNWNLDIGPGSGCLIATAAYGTAVDPRLDILRNFRDRVMAQSSFGRAVIQWYYQVSPPIAEYIATRPMLRAVVRALLLPLLLAISYPLVSLLLAIILVLAALYWYRRRLDGRTITAS